ncbi:hypothetical protein KE540_15435 [Lachnospiraceae bacterium Marseille-Q4251]|nr:hypothetical protein [Lachnospiraceae bacterium Marseille-Q4251]
MRICLDLTIDQEEDAKMEPLKLLFLSKDENRWRQTDVSGKLSRPFFFKDLEKEVNRIWSSAADPKRRERAGQGNPDHCHDGQCLCGGCEQQPCAGMNANISKPLDMVVLESTMRD